MGQARAGFGGSQAGCGAPRCGNRRGGRRWRRAGGGGGGVPRRPMERMQLAESAEAAGDAAAAHAHYTGAAADLAAAGDKGAAEAARQRAAALAPLRAHEQELAAEDAVTRHDMYQVIAQYIKAGGKPQRAISLLADGFRGHAAMVELMATWLAEASADDSRARGDIEAAAGGGTPKASAAGRRGRGSFGSANMSDPLAENADEVSAGANAGAAVLDTKDAVLSELLSNLIRERFDGKAADRIFEQQRKLPEWFDGLVANESTRRLLYSLSDEHRSCMLLELAINAAWKRGGCAAEIARVRAAAELFPVISGVLVERLVAAARQGHVAAQATAAVSDFLAAACHSEATYCYAQMLLARLEGGGDDASTQAVRGVAKGLSARLEQEAVTRHGSYVFLLSPLLTDAPWRTVAMTLARLLARGRPPTRRQAEELLRMFDGDAAKAANNPASVGVHVYGYADPDVSMPGGETPAIGYPPPAMLARPRARRLLLEPLFSYGERPDAAYKEALMRLLAIGSAARDGGAGTAGSTEAGQTGGAGGGDAQSDAVERASAALMAALEALAVAESAAAAGADELKWGELCAIAAAAEGVLVRCRGAFGSKDFYLGVSHRRAMPRLLAACVAAAAAHPSLRGEALSTVMVAMRMQREFVVGDEEIVLDIDLSMRAKKQALEALVKLAVMGHAGAVMRAVSEWMSHPGEGGADPSLLRHFMSQLLAAAAPPYALPFVRAALQMAERAGLASHEAALRPSDGAHPLAAEGLSELMDTAARLPADALTIAERDTARQLRNTLRALE